MITIYNNASAFYWYPLKFNFQGNQYESIHQKYYFNNGLIFNGHSFLFQAMDYSNNSKTSLFLTDLLSASSIFKNKEKPKDRTDLTQIISTLSVKDNFVVSTFVRDNKIILQKQNRTNISDTDVLKFTIDQTDDNLIFIENSTGQVLECNGIGSDKTYFSTKVNPSVNKQRFEYFLSDSGKISFFLAGSNGKQALTINSNNDLVLEEVSLKQQEFRIPDKYIFQLDCYKKIALNEDYVSDSRIVEYTNRPIDPIESLIKDDALYNQSYLENFLIMFPTETPLIIDDEAVYNVDYLGLKNYQNADYDYFKGSSFVEENPYIRRIYWRIHTGTNQEDGYDNIFLGYTSNSTKLLLKSDKETQFQFSPVTPRVPLSASNLIESGAIAGEHPLTSDRIYGLSINYKNTLPAVSQPVSFFRETGTWLCSWLKGSQNGQKQWMDRYYNSAYYSMDVALSGDYIKYNPRIDPTKPYIFDVPSTLILEPGAFYKYFRQGKNSSSDFLKYLDFSTDSKQGAKILHVENWNETVAKDLSQYKHNGLIINKNAQQSNPLYYEFNGSNHIIFPSTNNLLINDKFTVSLWLNVDNWDDFSGWQIFGNYYNGGWGLINDAGQISPLLSFVENKNKAVYTLNYRAGISNRVSLSSFNDAVFEWILRTPDFNYWIVDTFNFIAYKIDSTGKIVNTDNNNIKKVITNIDQVLFDKDLNLVVFDKTKGVFIKIDQNGEYVSQTEDVFNVKIDFRNNDNSLVRVDSKISVIDNENNLWEIVGENLYYSIEFNNSQNFYINKKIKAHIGKCQSIACDSDNNLWMITKNNFLIKYNTKNDSFEVNEKLLDDLIDPCKITEDSYPFCHVGIIRTSADEFYKDCKQFQKKLYDVVVVLDTINFEIYYFQTTGQLIKTIDLRSYIENEELRFNTDWIFDCKGDFTGFDYIRKFNNPLLNNLSWKLKISDPIKNNISNITLNYNVSSLPSGWHNFSFVFDGEKGECNYYIDSIPVDTKVFPQNNIIYYEYFSPILLGATTIKNTTLNNLVQIEDGYKFKGKISEIRMYNKSLNSSEIEQLYFANRYSINRGDMKWNLAIQERNYIEKINHFFKYQLPGNKTNYFNINIHNFNVNADVKEKIEDSIRKNINNITPYNTTLNKINWI
jgi:hypothetical protein